MFLCLCRGIRDGEFNELVTRYGACPIALARAMGLDEDCCGRCEAKIEDMIQSRGLPPKLADGESTEPQWGNR